MFAGWTPQTALTGPSTDAGPGVTALGSALFLFWKDTGTSDLSFSARI